MRNNVLFFSFCGFKNKKSGYYYTYHSNHENKKSISYPNITLLIFDEFLIDKGHQMYLPDEPVKLLNLYETVARPGTGHPRVILFMLANAITITNPYFLFWNLKMPIKKDKNGKLLSEIENNRITLNKNIHPPQKEKIILKIIKL